MMVRPRLSCPGLVLYSSDLIFFLSWHGIFLRMTSLHNDCYQTHEELQRLSTVHFCTLTIYHVLCTTYYL